MRRYSKQREAVLKALRKSTTHPSAEEIYLEVKKEIPNISLGTVYRNLSLLKNEDEIMGFFPFSDSEHFDKSSKPHQHFCCEKCGKIFDVNVNTDLTDKSVEEILDCKIKSSKILFYGLCSECK